MTDMSPATAMLPQTVDSSVDVVTNALAFVRRHLDMEVAYLSEFVDDELVFRAVDAPNLEHLVNVGSSMRLDDVYCPHILSGRLPELIPDTDFVPFTQTIPLTKAVPVRAHVSVPIRRLDGSIYGMFCCLSRQPRPSLNSRDLDVMRAFASLTADQINASLTNDLALKSTRQAIEDILQRRQFEIALQPIFNLKDQYPAGYEALCRFLPEPYRPPNLWFADADKVGLQTELEMFVIEVALDLLPLLPADSYLSVNASPATLAGGQLTPLIAAAGGDRVLVEITEHAEIDDIDRLLMEIDLLRETGARIAVDDAGAGYSGLQQILRLRPDVIKLDMSLTQDVDKDLARRSLASAMVKFAVDTNAYVVAEGIETEAEMRALKSLGVQMGQGYHLARPQLASSYLQAEQSA